jgi:hypothetical protein
MLRYVLIAAQRIADTATLIASIAMNVLRRQRQMNESGTCVPGLWVC